MFPQNSGSLMTSLVSDTSLVSINLNTFILKMIVEEVVICLADTQCE